ncbi:hypothetical protein ACEPAG_2620 [Sanghuangporus baumii]
MSLALVTGHFKPPVCLPHQLLVVGGNGGSWIVSRVLLFDWTPGTPSGDLLHRCSAIWTLLACSSSNILDVMHMQRVASSGWANPHLPLTTP